MVHEYQVAADKTDDGKHNRSNNSYWKNSVVVWGSHPQSEVYVEDDQQSYRYD